MGWFGVAVLPILACGRGAQGLRVIGAQEKLQPTVDKENANPTLRIVRPGLPASDRSIEVLFPERVTAVRQGSSEAVQLYLWRREPRGGQAAWRRFGDTVEYERDLPGQIHFRARASLEPDGVRFHYEFHSALTVAYSMKQVLGVYREPVFF